MERGERHLFAAKIICKTVLLGVPIREMAKKKLKVSMRGIPNSCLLCFGLFFSGALEFGERKWLRGKMRHATNTHE